MTPAWRRLMGLIRLGKWVGLVHCVLLAAAIPLSTIVHFRFTWVPSTVPAPQTVLLAHGAVIIENVAQPELGVLSTCTAACPTKWPERVGLIWPGPRFPYYAPKLSGLEVPVFSTGYVDDTSYTFWEFLVLLAWPTAFLWLTDRPVRRRRRAPRARRALGWLGGVALAGVVAFQVAGMYWRIALAHTSTWAGQYCDWVIRFEYGSFYFVDCRWRAGICSNPVDAIGMTVWRIGPFALGAYRTRFRWNLGSMVLGDSARGRDAIPSMFVAVFIAAPLFCLAVRSRRTPPGMCEQCGYNLTGNVSGVCPECGTAVNGAGREAAT